MRHLLLKGFTLATVLTAGAEVANAAAKEVPTKAVMSGIYGALQTLLPYSLSQKNTQTPKAKLVLETNFKTLAANAALLPKHTEHHDATFKFLGQSLAYEAEEANRRFLAGNTPGALALLDTLADNCVACHSRLPAASSPRAQDLFKNVDESSLLLEEKARLYLATRQFDKSLKAYRDMLLSSEYSTEQIISSSWLEDYLTLAVQVKRDFKDAQATLTEFKKRPGLPSAAKQDLDAWLTSLAKLDAKPAAKVNLEEVRRVLKEAKAQSEFPLDKQAFIHYLYAASLLHELVQGQPSGEAKAETYYLLAMVEKATDRAFWITQNDYYLEVAIKSAPASSFASKAYAQLERNLNEEYSGSRGTNIPPDVEKNRDDLKKKIDEAKRPKGK